MKIIETVYWNGIWIYKEKQKKTFVPDSFIDTFLKGGDNFKVVLAWAMKKKLKVHLTYKHRIQCKLFKNRNKPNFKNGKQM